TTPYFWTPGRFATRRDGPALTITPRGLDRQRIGVAKGTAHEAFLQTFFRTSRIVRFETPEKARAALLENKVSAIFGDGIGLTFWINGSLSAGCCDLAGGAYLEPMFFGDGIAIAVKRGNRALRSDLNDAIAALRANGRMLELLQRYFPRKIF
ncbi:MAG: transporter substrate-binding domain-containing protein, partial [Pseudomonadota bacterium]